MEQAKHTQQLQTLATSSKVLIQNIDTSINKLIKSIDNIHTSSHTLSQTSIKLNTATTTAPNSPTLQQQQQLDKILSSLAKTSKAIAKTAEDLQTIPAPHLPTSLLMVSPFQTYATVTVNNNGNKSNLIPFNPNTPEYIMCIYNRLHIQERQIYILFNNKASNSPMDQGGPAAYTLQGKANKWLCALDQETSQMSSPTIQLMRALHFTEHSAILLKLDLKETTLRFLDYCTNNNLLSHFWSTAKVLPHTYCVIMKFVPCDGTFESNNKDHIHTIEIDHNLEPGSIILASWIKCPKLHSPHQRLANVKVTYSSPSVAN